MWALVNVCLLLVGTVMAVGLGVALIDYPLVWIDANMLTMWIAVEVTRERG